MFSLEVGKEGLALRKSKGQVGTDTGVLVWDADDVSSRGLESSVCLLVTGRQGLHQFPPLLGLYSPPVKLCCGVSDHVLPQNFCTSLPFTTP